MKTTLSHRFSWLVIIAFTFQTIWPSWVMASETETVPPLTSLRSFSPRSPSFVLQTFVDEGGGGDDFTFSAKHSLTIPKYGSVERTQYFLNQSLDVKAFYPGLNFTTAGFSWSQYGFNFLLDSKEHLFVSADSSKGLPISSKLRIYNPNGNIILGEGLALEHLLLKGQSVFHIGSRSKIDQMDIWATGTSKGSGVFQNNDKASLATSKVSIHDGWVKNWGHWNIGEVLDLKGHNFTNHSELFFASGAALVNGHSVKNFGRFSGADYSFTSHIFHNLGKITGNAVRIGVEQYFSNVLEIKAETHLQIWGAGVFEHRGTVLSAPKITIDNAHFESLVDWQHDRMEVEVSEQTSWKIGKDVNAKFKSLKLAKSAIEVVNDGTIEAEAFINHRDVYRNRGTMTLGQWEQLGLRFINESEASVEVSDKTTFNTDLIENQGNIILGGVAHGRIGNLMNQGGGFVLKSDATLTGINLTNTKLFKTEKAFTWSGQTVENKGKMVAKGKTRYKAKSFTSTRGSSFTAEQLLTLFLEENLALYGNWLLKQGALVNAPTIGTFGRFDVPGGETTLEGYFTNYGFGTIAHLILKKETLTNDGGRLFIQKLTNLSPEALQIFNCGKDEATKTSETKTHLEIQGGFGVHCKAERVDNSGQLSLKNGIYCIDHLYNHDEKGTAEIDRLSLLGDYQHLYGKILINEYIDRYGPQTQNFTIYGNITILKGNLQAELVRLRRLSHLTLGHRSRYHGILSDRFYDDHSIKTLEIHLDGTLTALPGMRIQTDSLQNLGGVIESATSLRVTAVEEGAVLKNEISLNDSTPSITVTNLQASSEDSTSQAELRKRVKLGILKAQNDIKLEFSKFFDLAEALSRHGKDWQCNGWLYLYGQYFLQKKDLELARRLSLNVVDFSSISRLSLLSLNLNAENFRLGLSNDRMASLEIHGPLTLSVNGDVDSRYGVMKASKAVKATSKAGCILVGDAILEDATDTVDGMTGHYRSKNGAKITTPDDIELDAPNGSIYTNYGLVYGYGHGRKVSLKALHGIYNQSGGLYSHGSIYLEAEILENLIGQYMFRVLGQAPFVTDLIQEKAYFRAKEPERVETVTSGKGEIISTGGPIFINVTRGRNHASSIRTPFSIYYNGVLSAVVPSYFENTNLDLFGRFRHFYDSTDSFGNYYLHDNGDHTWIAKTLMADIIAGENINISMPEGAFDHTGVLSGDRVTVSGSSVAARNTSGKRERNKPQVKVVINLAEFIPALLETAAFRDGLSKGSGIDFDGMGSEAPLPFDLTQAALDRRSSYSGFRGVPRPLFSSEALRYLMLHILPDLFGTVRMDGLSGDPLFSRFFNNGKITEESQTREGQLFTPESGQIGMLFNRIIEMYGHAYYVPQLFSTPEMYDYLGNNSGDIRGESEVRVGVEDSIHMSGNAVSTAYRTSGPVGSDAKKGDVFMETKTDDINLNRVIVDSSNDVIVDGGRDLNLLATQVKAAHDVAMRAAQDTRIEALTHRVGTGDNYSDEVEEASVTAGNDINIHADLDAYRKGVIMKAGGNITLTAARRIIDESLAVARQRFNTTADGWTLERVIRQSVSEYEAGKKFTQTAGVGQTLYAPKITSGEKVTIVSGEEGTKINEVHDEYFSQSHSEQKSDGLFGLGGGKSSESRSSYYAPSVGATIQSQGVAEFTSIGDNEFTNINLQVRKTVLTSFKGVIRILLGTDYSSSSYSSSESDMFIQSQSMRQEEHHTYQESKIPGIVEIHAKELIVEEVRSRTLEWLERAQMNGGNIIHIAKEELHHIEEHEVQGLTAAFGMVIALAVTIATQGTGTALGGSLVGGLSASGAIAANGAMATAISGMTAATFTTLCSKAALAVLNNQGDIGKAAKSLLTKESLKSLGVDAAVIGLTGGGVKPTGFIGHFAQQANKALYRGLVEKVVYGRTDEKEIALGALSSAVGATISADIGGAHYNGDIQGLAHKALHAVSGGIQGLIQRGEKGITAGALGAVVAETVADIISPTGGLGKLDAKDRPVYSQDRIKITQDVARLTASMAALLAGMDEKDIAIAISTATVAVENNFAASAEKASEGQDEAETKEAEDPELAEIEEELSYLNHLKSEAGEFERPMTPRTLAARKAYVECERELLVANEKQRFAYQQMGITPESRANSAYLEAQVKVGDALLLRSLKGEILSPYENEVKRDYVLQRTFGFAMDIASSRFGLGGTVLKRAVRENQTPSAAGILESGRGKPYQLAAPKMVKHHIFNVFRGQSVQTQKYRDFFKTHGIKVDKYCIKIPESTHQSIIHSRGKDWTNAWKQFIDSNPHASTKEVYQFAGKLMDQYNVSHVPIVPYK